MLRIVMDSAGDLPRDWIDEYQIDIIPINVHLGDHPKLEGVDLTPSDFYHWVEETGMIPKSSQPTPQQYQVFYRKIAQPGDTILSIHLTSKLSGTYESAVAAAAEMKQEGYKIIPFDSLSGTAIQGFMCCEARAMDRRGADLPEILRRMEEIRDKTEVIFTLDSLDFARKSGRVQMLETILASILKIKPIIVLKEGTLTVAHKVRTRKASLDYILQEMSRRVGNTLVNAAVMHAHDLQTALKFGENVQKVLNCGKFFVEELSIGIAANLGPGAIGIIAYPAGEGI
jgi:DegV family protein with EDD domain